MYFASDRPTKNTLIACLLLGFFLLVFEFFLKSCNKTLASIDLIEFALWS